MYAIRSYYVSGISPHAATVAQATRSHPVSMAQNLAEELPQPIRLRIFEKTVRVFIFDKLPTVHENDAVGNLPGETHFMTDAQHGHAGLSHRITSYNVCYTKLLRVQHFDPLQLVQDPPGLRGHPGNVITSYSIHYTKLYDTKIPVTINFIPVNKVVKFLL